MSTLKVNNIQNANGTSAIAIDSSGVATFSKTLVPSSSMMYRNLIINGDMRIDQRNAGSAVTSAGYTVDRFKVQNSTDGAFSVVQDTDAPSGQGFTNSLKYTVTTADASLTTTQNTTIIQVIEGLNTAHLKWGTSDAKTVTLSFWVKSSLTGTFSGSLRNTDNSRSYPFTYTISSANTWENKTITISGDNTGTWLTTNEIGISVIFSLGTGPDRSNTANSWYAGNYLAATGEVELIGTLNATWQITGVQLEVGDTATPFEHRPYGAELALCQRYYWQQNYTQSVNRFGTGVMSNASTADGIIIELPVSMRVSPTLAFNQLGLYDGSSTGVINSVVANYSTNKILSGMALCTTTWSSATRHVQVYAINSTAYISASAEL